MDAIIETKELEKGVTDVTTKALTLKVISVETYQMAGEILLLHKDMEKKIQEYFKPLKSKAHDSWKAICNAENQELGKLQPGVSHLSREMSDYNISQEKTRKAEEERLRLEALKREEEERLQAAIEAEREGNKEEAEAILTEPVYIPPPIVPKTVPKVSGLTQKETWDFEIIAEKLIPRKYMQPNLVAIRAAVTSLKGKTEISGVRVFPKTNMVGARR